MNDFSIFKKSIIFLIFSLSFALIGGSAATTSRLKSVPKNEYVVVIDAGHGGLDGGVSGKTSGICESEINLEIAKKLEFAFKNAGFKVVMTRSDSGGLYGLPIKGYKKRDMQKRAEIIKNATPDLFISIHQNYFSDCSRRGAQTFFYDETDKNFALALQKRLNDMSSSSRDFNPLFGDYFVLKQADCPSCLIECGFLSNEADEKLLITAEYQSELAQTIFLGTLDFLTSAKNS